MNLRLLSSLSLFLSMAAAPACAESNGMKALTYAINTPSVEIKASVPLTGNFKIDMLSEQTTAKLVRDFEGSAWEDYRSMMSIPEERDFVRQEMLNIQAEYAKPSNRVGTLFWAVSTDRGGAHGMVDFYTDNYDEETGQKLMLTDLFQQSDIVLKIFSIESSRLLQEKGFSDSETLRSGTEPHKENFSAFLVTSNGIRIQFQPYQVGAYAEGTPFVEIPLSVLKEAGPKLEYWKKSR